MSNSVFIYRKSAIRNKLINKFPKESEQHQKRPSDYLDYLYYEEHRPSYLTDEPVEHLSGSTRESHSQ